MHRRPPLLFRAIAYGLRGRFLIRPFIIALALGVSEGVLSSLEECRRSAAWVPATLFPSRQDPQVAQVILSAMPQFSPRILVSFVHDRGTQWTLGVFLGTFSYCMAALPAARSLPVAFVPVLTVTGAMLPVLVAVGWLIFFINHISQAISVNYIVDRIARETELVIDELMPRPRTRFEPMNQVSPDDTDDTPILNQTSGYVRFVNIYQLLHLAKTWRIRMLRPTCCHARALTGWLNCFAVTCRTGGIDPVIPVSQPEGEPTGRFAWYAPWLPSAGQRRRKPRVGMVRRTASE